MIALQGMKTRNLLGDIHVVSITCDLEKPIHLSELHFFSAVSETKVVLIFQIVMKINYLNFK